MVAATTHYERGKMNTGTILQVSPGKIVPKEHIEAIRAVFPTVLGFSLQNDGELIVESHDDASFTTEDIMEVQEIGKDAHRVFFFGNWPSFEDVSDVMPYVMTNKEEAPILSFYLDGDFSNMNGLDAKHTDEYNTVINTLFPRIAKAYEDAGEDFDKFIVELKSEGVKKLFATTFKGRGWITFLPYKGTPFGFGNNGAARGFEWGTLSNSSDVKIPEPVKVEEKKSSALSFLKNKKAGAAVMVEKPAEPIHDPKTETATTYTMVEAPKQLERSARNAWVRLFYGKDAVGLNPEGEGSLPANNQSKELSIPVHPSLVPFAKENVQNSKDVKSLAERVKGFAKKSTTPVDMKAAHTEIEKTKSTVREKYEPSVGEYPVMSEDDKSKAMEKLIKFLDAGSKKRLTPIELQKMEAKLIPFSTDMGIKFEDMFFRSVDELKELFDGNMIAVSAFCEMRRYAVEKGGIKLEELVSTTKKDDAIPEKKSALGFLKNKKVA
jgi:hypothetical protein